MSGRIVQFGRQTLAVRWLAIVPVLCLAFPGPRSASADVRMIQQGNTSTRLYEVTPTPSGLSEPITLPTSDYPVLIIASVKTAPYGSYGSAMATITYHSKGVGIPANSGELTWSGVQAYGSATAGTALLRNDGSSNTSGLPYILNFLGDSSPHLLPGPKPNQFRVLANTGTVVSVQLMWVDVPSAQ